jgi:fibronectin type 3 domain-containing protein
MYDLKLSKYCKIVALPIVLAVVLLPMSCSRDIERPTRYGLAIDAPATPAGITVGIGDRTIELSWQVTTGAGQYRIYRADDAAANFRLYDSTNTASFTDRNVANNVLYRYQIASVNPDGLEGVRSPAVSGRSGVFSLAINDDKQYTDSQGVTLSLTGPGSGGTVRIAESADLTDRPWLPYASSKSWELSSGDGEKTVYAEFRDASGATSIDLVSDNIILDTRAVIDSVAGSPEGTLSAAENVLFLVAAGETDGEASVQIDDFSVDCYDDGTHGDTVAGDGLYHRLWEVPYDADFESQAPVGNFTDRAGNKAESRSSQTLLTVRRAPDPVTVFAFTESEARIGVSWTQSDVDDFEYYRLFRDTAPGVNDQSTMVFSTSSATVTTYADTGLDAATDYHYSVWVYDQTGLTAGAAAVSARTEVNTAPEAVIVSEPVDLDDTRLRITWTASTEDDFASYRLYRSPGNKLLSIITSRTQTEYTDDNLDLENESYQYRVEVWDRGDLNTSSATVSWDADVTPLDKVTVTTPQRNADTTSVQIYWTPSRASNFETYQIFRSTDEIRGNSPPIGIISNRTETQYVDGSGDFKTETYYYWVAVFGTTGDPEYSDPVVWIPPPPENP